ncbi:MAG: hypothetical protein V7703_04035 [Hyphomicrobiales bacterium]
MNRIAQIVTIAAMSFFATTMLISADELDEAYTAYEQGDFETAAMIWLKLAEAGDGEAQFNMGFVHDQGLGVNQDEAVAFDW